MANQDAKMRSGAVDFGRLYEQRIATYLAIKSALDPDIADFWMVSNINDVGDFDDIVLMTQDQTDSKKLYCIQLKHSENKKDLQAVSLENDAQKNSKFGLKKYQNSFDVIEQNIAKRVETFEGIAMDQTYLILWTNGQLTGTKKLQNIKAESVGGLDFLNTSSESNVYKISNLPSSKIPFNENFLKRFYLFAKQSSATSLDRMIKDKLSHHFSDISNSVIIAITDYFTKWSMGDGKSIRKITKCDIQRRLLEFIIHPHVIEPNQTETINPDKLDLVNDTLVSFNITPITEAKLLNIVFSSTKFILDKLCHSCLELKLSWNTDLSPTNWNFLKSIDDEVVRRILKILQERVSFVPYITIRDVYFAAWQCRLVPLVVNCSISKNLIVSMLLELKLVAKDLSFVLLNSSDITKDDLKVFRNINNIENILLRKRNLGATFISLQSKQKINLEKFEENAEVLDEVTPDVYLRLMGGIFELSDTIETENYYVKRDLRRPVVNLSVLNENRLQKDREYMFNKSGDIFVLAEYTGCLPIKYKNYSTELLTFLRDETYRENEAMYILLTNLKDSDGNVISAANKLHKETEKAVHAMKIKHNYLEWSFSKGTVETLQYHVTGSSLLKDEDSEHNISEDDILRRSRSDVNIISNNAGMGKTFMLKSIANKFEPDEWVCYVNLSEHITKIPQDRKLLNFLQYINNYNLNMKEPYIKKFCNAIYINCVQTKKIVFLFDGYDEVSSAHALSFLAEAKKNNLRMWITTRPTYKKELEIHMENLSSEMTHFSTEDHVTFLWRYFQSYSHIYQYGDDQIQYIIDTINKCSSNLDKTFIALPLQTRMFAEIFGDDINQITEKEKLTMVDLYNKFVDVKLKEYKSYEATSLKRTLSKLALKLFFTEEVLQDILDFDDLAEEAVTFQESYRKDSIVIGLNEKGEAVFGHRTFAEFLAAYWLAKQTVRRKGEYNLRWLPVLEKLYYIEMIPVRLFFDRILSQNLPLHVAVLNNDKEAVQSLLKAEELLCNLDALGRSPLHLAMTYGRYYDLYVAREVKGLKNIGLHSLVQINSNGCRLRVVEEQQFQISNEIVDELLNRGFINTTDRFFRYDLFDYAMKSCSLNCVHSLFKRFEKVTLYFEIGFSFEIFLYCLIRDNLYNVLSRRKSYDFDPTQSQNKLRDMFKGYNSKLLKIKYNDMYLTEVAALSGAKEVLLDLLQSGILQIGDGDIMHKACFNGHSDILELLFKMGLDVDKLDESNWSPLFQAGKRGRADIVYHLLKNSSSRMTKKSSTSMTPIHYSVQGGHYECVKKLIEYGAKVNVKDGYGTTPLHYACKYGYANIIKLLLTSGLIDISDDSVRSSINVAAFHGYSDCVKKLVECGLNVNNIDDEGNSPLVIASKKGFSNIVSELVTYENCDLNLMVRNESMGSLQMYCGGYNHTMLLTKLFLIRCDRKQKGGITALHFCARLGHDDCAKILTAHGADKHMEDEITHYIPLIWASMYGFEKVIKVLLANKPGEENDMNTRNEAELGLIWSSILGYEKCVEVLCDYIGNLDIKAALSEEHQKRIKALVSAEFGTSHLYMRENENSPLVMAARNGCPTVIKTLITKKFYSVEDLGEALHWAARNGHIDCVKELIESGADENKKNQKFLRLLPITWASMHGKTNIVEYFLSDKKKDYLENKDIYVALNWAAVGGHVDCLKLLLDFGLDVDNMDTELDATPIICACQYSGTIEVVEALMERNCKVDIVNNGGFSALHFAAQGRKFEFVKRLVNSGALQDLRVEKDSDLYRNLQFALQWAVEKEEYGLIERLIGLGISVDTI